MKSVKSIVVLSAMAVCTTTEEKIVMTGKIVNGTDKAVTMYY